MNINAIREFVNSHPERVLLRMVDGTEYPISHRDYVWFTPGDGTAEQETGRFATSFFVAYQGVGRLVNSMLVAEVVPLTSPRSGPNGQSNGAPPA